jgi:hypothetical protein
MLFKRIYVILLNPFYCGKMRWKGVVSEGAHEPLISKELFELVQTILRRKTKNPSRRKHTPVFKAKIHCEHCGGMLTWEIQKGHWYGHCHNHKTSRHCSKKTYIRQEKVEEQILAYLPQIAPRSTEMLAWIELTIQNDFEETTKLREAEITRLNAMLAKIRHRKDKFYEALIDQTAPEEFCNRKIKECLDEEECLKTALDQTDKQSDVYKDLHIAIHRLAFYGEKIYNKASVEERRLLLSQIFTNLLQNGYEIKPKYTKAAEYLAIWMPKLNQDYELEKMLTGQGQTVGFALASPVMRAWRETLRLPNWHKMFLFPNSSLETINKLLALV